MKTIDENIINKYLQGELSSSENADIKKAMAEDKFLKDAIEGYKKHNTTPNDLIKISNKFVASNHKKNKKIILRLAYSGVAAIIFVVLIMVFNNQNINLPESIVDSHNNIPNLHLNQKVSTDNNNPITESINKSENKTTDSEDEITLPVFTTELRSVNTNIDFVPESIAPLYINKTLIIENTVPEKDLEKYYRFRSNHNYLYLGSFKVVDYRFAGRNINNNEIIATNTEIINKPTIKESIDIPYIEFLDDALKNVSNKKYAEAIEEFNIILEQYPDDQNATFYKGICYYETNKNNLSLSYFDAVLNNKINTFHEDAKWYKSLVYKKERQYEIAQKVLTEIVNENGYYGVQAKQELNELYKYYMKE